MSDDSDYELDDDFEDNEIPVYEGQRNDQGERHGHGKADFPNGDVYEGEYQHGKRHGFGKYRFKRGKYEGGYVKGKRNGTGFMHYPDGSTYYGQWKEGDKCGVGTYTFCNGDIYEGEWKDDQKHGKGTYTYKATGTRSIGHWVEGVREGPAEWFNKGHSYKGYFRNNHPFGRGKFSFDMGCELHGYYKVTNLVEQVDKQMEVVGHETRWTCTSLRGSLSQHKNSLAVRTS